MHAGACQSGEAVPETQDLRAQFLMMCTACAQQVCTWAGVTCNANGKVTGLHFLNNGSVLVGERLKEQLAGCSVQQGGGPCMQVTTELAAGPSTVERTAEDTAARSNFCAPARAGNIGDVLYGASLIPNFAFFDTSYQALTGTLPNISLPNMQILDLSNNYLSVRCPLLAPLPCLQLHAITLLWWLASCGPHRALLFRGSITQPSGLANSGESRHRAG